jgi:hypothetical protein
MDFDEVLAQVCALLQREGRVSYRTLKRRFGLDDDCLEDLEAELIDAKRLAIDEAGKVLVWAGDISTTMAPMVTPSPAAQSPVTEGDHAAPVESLSAEWHTAEVERRQLTESPPTWRPGFRGLRRPIP